MLVFLHIKCVLYICSKFSGADVFIYCLVTKGRKTSKVKIIPKRLGRVPRANPVNIDTGGGGVGWLAGHKSVRINGVSVSSGLNFEKMRGLTFPRDKENCP